MKSPKYPTIEFSGDTTKWREFIDAFDRNYHNKATLAAVDKFNFLKLCLKSPATDCLIGIPVDEAHYAQARDVLEKQYGQKDQLIDQLNDQLINLRPVTKHEELKPFADEFEKICKLLAAEGVNVGSDRLIERMARVKLPPRIREKIHEIKYGVVGWDTNNFREHLAKIVAIYKNAGEDYTYAKSQKPVKEKSKTSNPVHAAVESKAQAQGDQQKCQFCKQPHKAYYCSVYKTPKERFDKVRELKLCTNCLKPNHFSKNCRSEKRCSHCEGKHFPGLCRSLGETSSQKSNKTQKKQKSQKTESHQSTSAVHVVGPAATEPPSETQQTPANATAGAVNAVRNPMAATG